MSIFSGLLGSNAASKATDAGVQASEKNTALARDIFNLTRADNTLGRNVGNQSLMALAQLTGLVPTAAGQQSPISQFQKSPGYQFRLGEGVNAIDRSAASRGLLNSGGTLKALTRYGQGVGSDEFNNYTNRLGMLAGFGTQANANNANAGANFQTGATQANNAAAQARISGYTGQANALGGIAGGAANTALLAKLAGWI